MLLFFTHQFEYSLFYLSGQHCFRVRRKIDFHFGDDLTVKLDNRSGIGYGKSLPKRCSSSIFISKSSPCLRMLDFRSNSDFQENVKTPLDSQKTITYHPPCDRLTAEKDKTTHTEADHSTIKSLLQLCLACPLPEHQTADLVRR